MLSPPEITELRGAYDRLVAEAASRADDPRYVVDTDPLRLHRVVWCGDSDPVFAGYGDDPRFTGVAGEVLGSTDLVQIIQQAHFKLPGDGVDFRWHQDASNRRYGTPLWTDVNGRGSFVQLALAVDPMTADNGPLRAFPGSQRHGFIADPPTGDLPPDSLSGDPVDLLLEPGDLAVFGPFLIHGSPPNRSEQPRRLFLQGYALPGANRREYPGCGTGIPRTVEA